MNIKILLAAGFTVALSQLQAQAVFMQVVSQDTPNCDVLNVPRDVHELGWMPPFPPDEWITSNFISDVSLTACPADNPNIPNKLVMMTNMTNLAYPDVWYVADAFDTNGIGTTVSNFDGLVDMLGMPVWNPGQAFKIDRVGINRPLVSESLIADGIFQPGEAWEFILQDYSNTGGIMPHIFDSVGVASGSAGGPPSSGSIIVPEPVSLVGMAAGLLVLRRRRN